ncbi:unnamed protein product, partial [Prorocentrum cordatum]
FCWQPLLSAGVAENCVMGARWPHDVSGKGRGRWARGNQEEEEEDEDGEEALPSVSSLRIYKPRCPGGEQSPCPGTEAAEPTTTDRRAR